MWNQISIHDYPNNAALTSVINAIDANKADKADIPSIDTTLSAAGAAADAKAVGQAIENIELTPGPKGDIGATGPAGKDGVDGITPHIGDNGNWFIGETDTGMPSRGEDAPQEAILYTPQALTTEQQTQARQNIGAIEAPETAEVGQTIVVKEVDENDKPILWEAADFPVGIDPDKIIFDIILEESVSEFVYPLSEDDIKKLLNSSILSFYTSLIPDSSNTEDIAGSIQFGLYPLAGHYYNEFKLMGSVPAIAPYTWNGPMFMTFTAFGLMWIGDGKSKVGAQYPTITGFHSGKFQSQLGLTQPDYSKLEVGYVFKITALSSELGAGSRMILSV